LSVRVRVVTMQPHCFAFGGFEIQMLKAMELSELGGIEIQPLNYFNQDEEFDVLHLWGMSPDHLNIVKWAKLSGKRVVITILPGYLDYDGVYTHIKRILSGNWRRMKKVLRYCDLVTVVNQGQKNYANKILGINFVKLEVVPNVIDEVFFEPFESAIRKHDVVCVGNICLRKNQLDLAKICVKIRCKIVIIGGVVAGEESYFQELVELSEVYPELITLTGKLPTGGSELIGFLRNSKVFALISHNEQQPISALEAISQGCICILSDKGYSRFDPAFIHTSIRVNPNSLRSIIRGLETTLKMYPDKAEGAHGQLLDTKLGTKLWVNVYRKVINLDLI
jgi:glycosyltransferase involved in cell wall biosynthesis